MRLPYISALSDCQGRVDRVYGPGRVGGISETARNFFGSIIFSYEKFRIRPSGNINRVKVANKKVLSANLAYANTGEQSG